MATGVFRLANGRFRAVVYDSRVGRNQSVATVLGVKGTTWASEREAVIARARALEKIHAAVDAGVTLRDWWGVWTSHEQWQRPAESTNLLNRDRTRRFVEQYGHLEMAHFDQPAPGGRGTMGDVIVSEWLFGGNRSCVPSLRAMFNDARSRDAGRLVAVNPFAELRTEQRRGRRVLEPPDAELAARMVQAAREVSGVSFAMWLKFAMATGMRPGEVDALRWEPDPSPRRDRRTALSLSCHVLPAEDRVWVGAQFNGRTGSFSLPKGGRQRRAILTVAAREALDEVRGELGLSEFCFESLRGSHWTKGARAYHWKAVAARVGWTERGQDLYLATRHFAGKYLYNDLRLSAEDVAAALGHSDRGELVRRVYGHFSDEEALARVDARVREATAA